MAYRHAMKFVMNVLKVMHGFGWHVLCTALKSSLLGRGYSRGAKFTDLWSAMHCR